MAGSNCREYGLDRGGIDKDTISNPITPPKLKRQCPTDTTANPTAFSPSTSSATPNHSATPAHSSPHANNPASHPNTRIDYHALWLSDIHLGCKDCKAEYLLSLLNQVHCQHLYLVGDIVDVWALKRKMHWPESHNQVLQKIIALAQQGTQVIYLPGNHDELLKPYANMSWWNINIARQHIHHGIGGRKLLMLHGDQFDSEVCVGRFYAVLGDHLYDVLLFLNRNLHRVRQRLGYPYWSLASYIKSRVSKAQVAISRYRQAVLNYAQQYNVDGVICGHIHQPELSCHTRAKQYCSPDQTAAQRQIIYANDGDWVENCTVLTETLAGELQLCRWNEQSGSLKVLNRIAPMIQQPISSVVATHSVQTSTRDVA